MADLFDLIDSAFGEDLWLAVIGVGTILAYTIGKHARHKFLRWRLNRQLARSNYYLANDPPEHRPQLLRQSPDATIPKEAILGAIGSVAIVAILLTLMLTL